MGTASRDPHLICRSKISLGFGTWAELENQDWPKNTQVCQKTPRYEGRGGPRRGTSKGRTGWGCTKDLVKGRLGTPQPPTPYPV